jgi:hypothetical protein
VKKSFKKQRPTDTKKGAITKNPSKNPAQNFEVFAFFGQDAFDEVVRNLNTLENQLTDILHLIQKNPPKTKRKK